MVVAEFIKNTIALLLMTWLGAAGVVDGVEFVDAGMLVSAPTVRGFAFGDIAYHGAYPELADREHEHGHLIHEDELTVLYLPIAIIGSYVGGRRQRAGEWEDYFTVWTESEADRLGGVVR